MRKSEAEPAIRALVTEWLDALPAAAQEAPSFTAFKDWLGQQGHSRYLDFRSGAGAQYDAETWFDDELGQNWRR